MKLFLTLFICIAIGCNTAPDTKHTANTTLHNNDTIPKLSPTRLFAQQLLQNKVSVTDSGETMNCLDSLSHPNISTRQFYFKVLLAIMKKADGAVSEACGEKAYNYLQQYPLELANQYRTLPSEEQERLVTFLGYEFAVRDAGTKELDKFFADLRSKCKDCSDEDKNTLAGIRKGIFNIMMQEYD